MRKHLLELMHISGGQTRRCGERTDLFASDLGLPQCAEHHVGMLHLPAAGPLALQAAQGVFGAHAIPLRYPGHGLQAGETIKLINGAIKQAGLIKCICT